MSDTDTKPRTATRPKTRTGSQRPRLHKVILLNDDYCARVSPGEEDDMS